MQGLQEELLLQRRRPEGRGGGGGHPAQRRPANEREGILGRSGNLPRRERRAARFLSDNNLPAPTLKRAAKKLQYHTKYDEVSLPWSIQLFRFGFDRLVYIGDSLFEVIDDNDYRCTEFGRKFQSVARRRIILLFSVVDSWLTTTEYLSLSYY